VELVIEARDMNGGVKVDKCVSHVTFVLEIDGKIKEIVAALMVVINSREKHFLTVFVRDIFNHQGRSMI